MKIKLMFMFGFVSLVAGLIVGDLPISTAQQGRDVIVVDDSGGKELRDERLAIVVGVNNYLFIDDLRYAVSDARLMKATLENKGNFTVEYYADDPQNRSFEPTSDNIIRAVKDAARGMKNGYIKTLVIYFAGHGFQSGDSHYLATIATRPNNLKDTSVKLDDLLIDLKKCSKKGKVMLFLDACRTDPSKSSSGSRGSYESWGDIDSHGLAILRSTTEGERSYEIPELGHGVYTYYLSQGLDGKGDYDKNGYVSYDEIKRYLYYAMKDWSRTNEYGKTQSPISSEVEHYGEFFITNTGKGGNVPPELLGVKYRDMVSVRGGTYTQESYGGESFRHTISDFSIGKYEVTYELWYVVYQWAIDNGYRFANAGLEGSATGGGDWPNYNNVGNRPTSSKYEPVSMVNWRDCIVWCNAYSELCGRSPFYVDSGGRILRDSRYSNGDACDNAKVDSGANGYRLPTEGEWQFASSDRGSTPFNYASGASDDYESSSACKKVAWYDANSGGETHKVGTKSSNDLGLYDMSGNVWEWCWDWRTSYPSGSKTDYPGPATGSYRVLRGGSWNNYSSSLQVGYRIICDSNLEFTDLGLRLAGL